MIIDLILDRKDGEKYKSDAFYSELVEYEDVWPELACPIVNAMNNGSEQEVRNELCNYIQRCGYDAELCEYINSVKWLN